VKKKTFVLSYFLFMLGAAFAQEFTIKEMELVNDQLVLHYDLIDTARGHTYTIFVYSSKDNFLNPLEKISGDAGLEVKPGTNKKIVWNVKEELTATFDGEIEMEVRGRRYIPFIRFEGFQENEVRKRGKPFLMKWSGGTRQNILNIQLYNGDRLAHTFANVPNEGESSLTIPTSVKTGTGYYFKIADTKNRDQVVLTPTFEITSKYPLSVKVGLAAIAVTGGFLVYLNTKKIAEPPDAP